MTGKHLQHLTTENFTELINLISVSKKLLWPVDVHDPLCDFVFNRKYRYADAKVRCIGVDEIALWTAVPSRWLQAARFDGSCGCAAWWACQLRLLLTVRWGVPTAILHTLPVSQLQQSHYFSHQID